MPSKESRPLSENRLVELIKSRNPARAPFLKKGIGDDAAVILPRGSHEYWLITTDMLVEKADFRREWTTAHQLGNKSIAVNLSDLAAMGARPRFFTVSLGVPHDISKRWILEFHDGLAEKATLSGACLIGGDLSSSDSIVVSISAMGESLNRKVVYRSGGKAGDALYVTGVLGRSAAGLKYLRDGCQGLKPRSIKDALRAHQNPEPRCEAGLWLAQSGMVNCMMDLSDGLSMDLPRLCAAGNVGAEVSIPDLPVFGDSIKWGCDPVAMALHGGEDYELLFSVPKSKTSLLERSYPATLPGITRIGEIVAGEGIWTISEQGRRRPLLERGFDHFARIDKKN